MKSLTIKIYYQLRCPFKKENNVVILMTLEGTGILHL